MNNQTYLKYFFVTKDPVTILCSKEHKNEKNLERKFSSHFVMKIMVMNMKIAVTTDNGMVFQHFGQTKNFTVFEVEGKEVKSKQLLNAGDNGHSALALLLSEQNVNVLICGGIGQGAKDALKNANVTLVAGASGLIDDVVDSYLAGNLQHNATFTCNHHHDDGHSCGEHSCGEHHCK